MPAYRRKESVGRNREIDYYLQSNGINVIPVVSYAYPRDFEWCLDGLPPNSSVAISTNGSMQNFVSYKMFIEVLLKFRSGLIHRISSLLAVQFLSWTHFSTISSIIRIFHNA